MLFAALLDSLVAFAEHFNVALYPWQADAFGQACQRAGARFRYRLGAISVPRGNGKSYAGAVVGLWRLLTARPPTDILSVALDHDGAKVVLDHAKRIVRARPELRRSITMQAGALVVPATGSRWTIASAEHTSSRGRHPDTVLYDETGWARDDRVVQLAALGAGVGR